MVVVIDKLKYDTDKMTLISDKCEYAFVKFAPFSQVYAKDVKLYKSNKGNWLLTYTVDSKQFALALSVDKCKNMLLRYDIPAYEKEFGKLEDA